MVRTAFIIGSLLFAAPAQAHDFWLQPISWDAKPGARVPFTVEVGHGAAREKWGADAKRVTVLQVVGPSGRTDLRRYFRPGGATPHLIGTFPKQGLNVVSLATSLVPSELPAIRFNDFLQVEGLTPAIEARRAAGATNRPGRELYWRRAKTLIAFGPASARDNALATRPLGLSLEIVPKRNPYSLGADRRLPVQILFEGRPLAGALVKLTSLEFDAKPIATGRSDGRGLVTFRVPNVGSWLVNVIWTKRIANPAAEFETTFSSLTFGYPPRHAR